MKRVVGLTAEYAQDTRDSDVGEEQSLVASQNLPFSPGKDLQLRQEGRLVVRRVEPRLLLRLLRLHLALQLDISRRRADESLLHFLGRPGSRATVQPSLRAAGQVERRDRRLACDLQEVVCDVVALLVRDTLSREVLSRSETTGPGVKCAAMRE